jgi:hypothetical protein
MEDKKLNEEPSQEVLVEQPSASNDSAEVASPVVSPTLYKEELP